MHPHAELITRFYTSFAARDHGTMAGCYRDDATFSDPVFTDLDAERARAMWRMFCLQGTDLAVTFSDVGADDRSGSARWEARYTFRPTGRPVHNRITASFQFRDGIIAVHRDDFDLYRWTRMALGRSGWLLGWTPFVQGRIRKQAAQQLERFIAEERSSA